MKATTTKESEIRMMIKEEEPSTTHNGLRVESQLLQVALVEELVGHPLGQAVLELPRLGDGAHVARRHQHAAQH